MPRIDITDIGLTVITGIGPLITDGGEGVLGEMTIGMMAVTGVSVHGRIAGVNGIIRRITETDVIGVGAPMLAEDVIGDALMLVAGVIGVGVRMPAAVVVGAAARMPAVGAAGVVVRRIQAEGEVRKDRDNVEEYGHVCRNVYKEG